MKKFNFSFLSVGCLKNSERNKSVMRQIVKNQSMNPPTRFFDYKANFSVAGIFLCVFSDYFVSFDDSWKLMVWHPIPICCY